MADISQHDSKHRVAFDLAQRIAHDDGSGLILNKGTQHTG